MQPMGDKTPRKKRQKDGQYGIGSVYPRGDGRWAGAFLSGYTKDGKRRRITVTAKTERECRKKLERRRADIAKDGTPEIGVSARTTVKTWADQWIRIRSTHLRPNTIAAYLSSINQGIVPTIGDRKLTALTPIDLRAVTAEIIRSGGSPTNALHAHRVLMMLLKAAVVEGGISVPNRVLLAKAPPKGTHDRTAIPLDDVRALLLTAAGDPDASRWVAALLQGMRQGECLGLTWSCVDLEAGTMDVSWQLQRLTYLDRKAGTFRVPPGYEHRQLYKGLHLVRPKTSRSRRIIPIVGFMWDVLVELKAQAAPNPHDLVWPSMITGPRIPAGRPRTQEEDADAWKDLQDRAGIAGVEGKKGPRRYVLHEARHTTATLLLESGVDPETVKQIMGHSSITTSRAYMHVSKELARAALEDGAGRLGLAR